MRVLLVVDPTTDHATSVRDVVRHGDNGRRLIRGTIRRCSGLGTSSRWLAMYDCAHADDQRRTAFLARVDRSTAARRDRFLDEVERRIGSLVA